MTLLCLWQPEVFDIGKKNEKSDRSLPSSLERPVFNDSEAINLTFGLTLQQIIDVVSPPPYHHHHHPHHLTLADYRCCESSISSSNIFIRNTFIDFSNLLLLLQQYYLWHHVFVHNIVLILTFPSMKSCEAFHPEFRTQQASCKSGSERGEDLLLQSSLFHFTISNFSLSPLLGGNYLPHIGLVVDIFGAPIQFLNISPPTIWNGTSVRQHRCGFPAWRWQNISLAFKIYFRNFIFFYFQNEKDQILTTNIWLNLVSTFVSSKNFRIRQYCSTAKIHQHSFSSFQ